MDHVIRTSCPERIDFVLLVSSTPTWVELTKKMMLGDAARAFRNTSRTARSDSPTNLLSNSGPLIARKLMPLSVAKALAIMVLLHPGGPYRRTPFGASTPSLKKVSR